MSLQQKIRRLEKSTGVGEKEVKIVVKHFLILSPTECVEVEGNLFSNPKQWRLKREKSRDKRTDALLENGSK